MDPDIKLGPLKVTLQNSIIFLYRNNRLKFNFEGPRLSSDHGQRNHGYPTQIDTDSYGNAQNYGARTNGYPSVQPGTYAQMPTTRYPNLYGYRNPVSPNGYGADAQAPAQGTRSDVYLGSDSYGPRNHIQLSATQNSYPNPQAPINPSYQPHGSRNVVFLSTTQDNSYPNLQDRGPSRN